jgi:pimeloyl-ACP methyl ester carboxylesterase
MNWNYLDYSLESHNVTTEDGYILTLTRLISRQGEKCTRTDEQFKVKINHSSVISTDNGKDETIQVLKPKSSPKSTRPSVLLVHGFLGCSNNFFEQSPDQTLRKVTIILESLAALNCLISHKQKEVI